METDSESNVILQTQTMNIYPDELVVVCLFYVFEVLISAPICLLAEGNLSAWKLKNSMEVVAVLNSVRREII